MKVFCYPGEAWGSLPSSSDLWGEALRWTGYTINFSEASKVRLGGGDKELSRFLLSNMCWNFFSKTWQGRLPVLSCCPGEAQKVFLLPLTFEVRQWRWSGYKTFSEASRAQVATKLPQWLQIYFTDPILAIMHITEKAKIRGEFILDREQIHQHDIFLSSWNCGWNLFAIQ